MGNCKNYYLEFFRRAVTSSSVLARDHLSCIRTHTYPTRLLWCNGTRSFSLCSSLDLRRTASSASRGCEYNFPMCHRKGQGLIDARSKILWFTELWWCIVHHTLSTVYLHYSVYIQKVHTTQNINYPASQQAASPQAIQTSAAASAARSKASILLRTPSVSTRLRTQV